jgi:RNA polymerase sigma-70 factor (ECF subfamily)
MEDTVRKLGTDERADYESVLTRESLLSRLKNRSDDESWVTFYHTYWRLIYNTAIRAGLNDAEAKDVVQETVVSVVKAMPDFRYDQKKGKFKGWLMRITQRRIADEWRKRDKVLTNAGSKLVVNEDGQEVDELNSIPDANDELTKIWDTEWDRNLWHAALERVKQKVDLKQYQIFDLFVFKNLSVAEIANTMNVNRAYVYLIKHRMQKLLKKESQVICDGAAQSRVYLLSRGNPKRNKA